MRCRTPWGRSPALLLAGVALAAALPAAAATFRVDRTDDEPAATACDDATPDDCSLRGAIIEANGAEEPSTIELPAGTYPISRSVSCTYRPMGSPNPVTWPLTSLCVTSDVTIRGAGAGATSIDGQGATRILYASLDAKLEIVGVTFEGGLAAGAFANGAAIWNDGKLTLRESVLRGNTAEAGGGALFSAGTLSVFASTFEANVGREGGAAWTQGPSSFVDSRFTNNSAGPGGALILVGDVVDGVPVVPVSITGSLVDGNTSGIGAIMGYGAHVVIANSTISGNGTDSGGHGGGVRVDRGIVELRNVTVTDNTGLDGGGLSILSGTVRIRNTLIAGNHAGISGPPDCLAPPTSPVVSEGYNLIGTLAFCSMTGDTTGNVVGQDPLLGALAANGGPTFTHSPGEGSPALEAGNPAVPGSGGGACAATDQRGFLRPEGERCDIGALEKPPGFALVGVEPRTAGNAGSVLVRAFGSGFEPGATIRLARAGQPDVFGSAAQVDLGGSALASTFDLAGRTPGAWDVVVSNPGGGTAEQPAAFTIGAGGGAEVWVDVTGRSRVRALRAATLLLQVGNRGTVDALGVPVTLSFPDDIPSRLYAVRLDPPEQPGQVFGDWSVVPRTVTVQGAPGTYHVPLLIPRIPAGTASSIRLEIVPAFEEQLLHASVGEPYFQQGVDPAAVARRAEAALAIVERTAGEPFPAPLAPLLPQLRAEVEAYVAAQLGAIRTAALESFGEGLGAAPRYYDESQLQLDVAYFAAKRVGELAIEQFETAGLPADVQASLLAASRVLERALAALGPAPAHAAIRGQKCKPGSKSNVKVLDPGQSSGTECEGPAGPDEIGPEGDAPEPTCFGPVYKIFVGVASVSPSQVSEGIRELNQCGPTKDQCEALPDHVAFQTTSGDWLCRPKDPDTCKTKCKPFPVRPVASFDPNDKVGRPGGGDGHFVSDRAPFAYTVYFENLETATAPAQEVVITDPLDAAQLDLSTLSLGPVSFGDSTVTPAPGLQKWSGGVDLRPEKNLVVTIDAALDEETGVLTWRFRSLDPDTLEFPEDPLAGFLPPNKNPPEGDGSVSFTVAPKADLADGATVCNDASIVFDVNEPILTPSFCNTLDETPPASEVEALPPVSPAEPFLVHWSSTDAGAGVAGTTVFVSVDGGPYETFVDAGPGETSAELTPEAGKLYAFYSVATDVAGNVEAEPEEADAETTTEGAGGHDLAVISVKAPKRVALSEKRPTRSAQVKVQLVSRSAHPETIATLDTLRALVTLRVESLGACEDATPVLQEAKLAGKLPLTWAPNKKLTLGYDVSFGCANDAAAGTPDYAVRARVNHLALGGADGHPQDDVCPRSVPPPPGAKDACAATVTVDVTGP